MYTMKMSSTSSMSKNSPLFLVPSTTSTIGNWVLYVWSRRNNSRFFGSGFKLIGTDSTVVWSGRIWTRTTTDWFMIVITYTTSLLEILCKDKMVTLIFVKFTNSSNCQRNFSNCLHQTIPPFWLWTKKKQNLSHICFFETYWGSGNEQILNWPICFSWSMFLFSSVCSRKNYINDRLATLCRPDAYF